MIEAVGTDIAIDFPIYGHKHRSLKKAFINAATGGALSRGPSDEVTVKALDRVSFHFRAGERIGLTGHNGSGKSTLLRVLAGAYEPVSGSVMVNGRVASMLSITLGLDAEATGMENIFLRAAILGARKAEVRPLVDEICAFADLGDYIGMPMRTYSSGMIMRLAFAISTTIASDVVLMDEWLSVGDGSFTDRAAERLRSLSSQGKLLVLASHDVGFLTTTCTRILRLEHGRIVSESRH